MFSSGTISRDFLHSNPSNQPNFKHASADREFLKSREFMDSDFFGNHQPNFKHASADREFLKSREFMDSDFFGNHRHHHHHHQQQSSGLARHQSAPSSFLAAILDSNTDNSSGDESDAFFTALMDAPGDLYPKSNGDNQISCGVKRERGAEAEPRSAQIGGYDNGIGSYYVGMERDGNGNRSNILARQSSSPAGFFNGYGIMGEVGEYRVHDQTENSSSGGGLSSPMNLSSCSSRFMPSIPETGNENGRLRNGDYEAVFHHDSWNEPQFNNLKRNRDAADLNMFSGLENQNGETRKKSNGLVSHFSLPKTSTEMAVVENLLQFQPETTVPCQIRAKRGFATHPRSIAERMRRSRISKNMKKLQDLFPNMDKQTNTAEMLDLAVEYIKDLQKQVQTLQDSAARCVCSSRPKQTSPTA